jgi:hypothetical protein
MYVIFLGEAISRTREEMKQEAAIHKLNSFEIDDVNYIRDDEYTAQDDEIGWDCTFESFGGCGSTGMMMMMFL